MTEERLTFLTEVELPPYCFMSEAVEWIAFGRVPQLQYHADSSTDGVVDYRFYWREMPDNFEPHVEYPWFDRLEFESLGVPMPAGYIEAAEKCAFEHVRDLPKRIADYEAKKASFAEFGDEAAINVWQKLADDCRTKLDEIGHLQDFVDTVETNFDVPRDIACAKLFQLLVTGGVSSEALDLVRWESFVNQGDYKSGAEFVDVPPIAYDLSFDWMKNEIVVDDTKFVALRVKTSDLLKNSQFLFNAGTQISVERFGAFYTSRSGGRSVKKSRVGRRSVVDWAKMKAHLERLALAGSLPDGKENCIYELIAFAESELGRTPSRTAVQRNLSAELDAYYAH